jgi:hypothetical protein
MRSYIDPVIIHVEMWLSNGGKNDISYHAFSCDPLVKARFLTQDGFRAIDHGLSQESSGAMQVQTSYGCRMVVE